jgi:hypothetical protein
MLHQIAARLMDQRSPSADAQLTLLECIAAPYSQARMLRAASSREYLILFHLALVRNYVQQLCQIAKQWRAQDLDTICCWQVPKMALLASYGCVLDGHLGQVCWEM